MNWKSRVGKLWSSVKSVLSFIWRHTLVYNILVFLLVVLLFYLILSRVFSGYFNCRYLIQDSLGMPSFMCEGAIGIPGLSAAMDPPLSWVRRGILFVMLFFFVVVSGLSTYIINNLKWVVKLLTFDKREWQQLLTTIQIFITILAVLCLIFLFV